MKALQAVIKTGAQTECFYIQQKKQRETESACLFSKLA